MRRLLLMALFWISTVHSVFAQEPMARIVLQETGPIVVGQQLHLTVDLFAPGFFTSAPRFPDLSIPNAIVTLPEQRAQNLVQTINDQQYSGIRQTYLIIPETSGDFSTPVKTVDIVYSTGEGSTKAQVTLTSIKFSASAPEGAGTELVAKKLKVTQHWSEQLGSLNVGDSITRTIVVTADSTQSMLMPAISSTRTPGFRAYPKPAQFKDGNSGQVPTATRTETIMYVAEKKGHYTLPAIDYPWFDLDANKLAIAHLDPVQVNVGDASSGSQAEGSSPAGQHASWRIYLRYLDSAIGLLGLATLFFFLWRAWRALNERRRHSERYLFRQLIQTTKSQSTVQIVRALRAWLRKVGHGSLEEWRKQIDASELATMIDALLRTTYYPEVTGPSFNHGRFRASLSEYRSTEMGTDLHHRQAYLPELNPF